MTTAVHPVDQILPARAMASLGFQHMLVSYLGAIAVPMIVASALKMTTAQTTMLISTALFTSGIATLLQTVGFWKFGVRLPLMQGVAFSSVAPVIAIGSDPSLGFNGVCGAIIGAGVITMLLAPVIGRLKRFFPPVVSGCTITAVGLSLFPVSFHWFGGGRGAPDFGSPVFFAVGFGVVALILLINRHRSELVRNLAVMIGLLVGGAVAWMLGMGNFDEVSRAPWFTMVTPFAFGMPVFDIGAITTMVIVMVVQMVESMGLFVAVSEIVKRPITEQDATRGLRANGLASAIGGMFAAFPYIAFMENVGLVIVTGVRSRWVVATCGVMLCAVALVPKIGSLFASIPPAALGGAAMVMFGVVVAAGIKTLGRVEYDRNPANLSVVSITLACAMMPVMLPSMLEKLPGFLQPFVHSSVIIACVVSVLLNLLLNGVPARDESEHPIHTDNIQEV
ncbi:nucleobase:cation symporter-2 family protein [Cupriavidus numazuensis]|uniref:Uric acid transporter UacT n=1 Tax=Cupriavidus numazuensis TaxID=221992 RepID=A0ABM8TMM0_9BURK|nr:nucleobase:cation symporter-2 family protein [Cupriavidus numazuensis]CAG2155140.1 Uric acid transporter UacT [Cupriavidus numazuensis]